MIHPLLLYCYLFRAHDHDEVVRKHPFSSGRPISNDESKPKRKRISCGHKSDHSSNESADPVDSFKEIIQSMETRHFERTKLEQERLKTEHKNLELVRKRQAADLENAARHA